MSKSTATNTAGTIAATKMRVPATAAAARGAGDDRARDADVQRFLERFCRFGAAPSVATYLPLFHPDATLFDDGMERPISVAEIPDSITATLGLAQGLVMVPERWRVRERAVFVEARNAATIFGTPVRWRSVYRIDLAGDLVLRGRRYYDRAPLLALLDPSSPRLSSLQPDADDVAPIDAGPCAASGVTPAELVEVCARGFRDGAWQELAALFRDDAVLVAPGLERPLAGEAVAAHRRLLGNLLGGAPLRARAWAGDASLVLIEWEADVPTPRGTYTLGLVDRFDLASGRILAARTYFDTIALVRALATSDAP